MRLVPSVRGVFGGAILVASVSACATTTVTDEELARLRRDVHALRTELAEAKTTIQKLEGDVTLLSAGSRGAAAAPPVARAEPSPSLPQLPVVRLEGSPSAPAAVPPARPASRKKGRDPDAGAVDDGGPPILIKLEGASGPGVGEEKVAVDRDVLSKPDPVLANKGARATEKRERGDYDAALAALRERREPAEARQLFVAFQARYPRSDLGDNVAFWLAQCSFDEGQWTRAIEEVGKLVEARPSSAKVPDALLLSAEAWLKLGKNKEAEEVLRRLIKTHPNSAARATADKRLGELGAT